MDPIDKNSKLLMNFLFEFCISIAFKLNKNLLMNSLEFLKVSHAKILPLIPFSDCILKKATWTENSLSKEVF
jgi:hypothetical protein